MITIERLREANRELETLDQTKADLVANVSHELKTPLTALRGYLELMLDGGLGALPTDAQRAAEICRKNVRRLSLRIEELVQVSRLERFTSPCAGQEDGSSWSTGMTGPGSTRRRFADATAMRSGTSLTS